MLDYCPVEEDHEGKENIPRLRLLGEPQLIAYSRDDLSQTLTVVL